MLLGSKTNRSDDKQKAAESPTERGMDSNDDDDDDDDKLAPLPPGSTIDFSGVVNDLHSISRKLSKLNAQSTPQQKRNTEAKHDDSFPTEFDRDEKHDFVFEPATSLDEDDDKDDDEDDTEQQQGLALYADTLETDDMNTSATILERMTTDNSSDEECNMDNSTTLLKEKKEGNENIAQQNQQQRKKEQQPNLPPRSSIILFALIEPIEPVDDCFPIGYASYADALVTESSTTLFFRGLFAMLCTVMVTWVKILFLASMVFDAIVPRCSQNDDWELCNTGMVCMPLISYNSDGNITVVTQGFATSIPASPTDDAGIPTGYSICNDCVHLDNFRENYYGSTNLLSKNLSSAQQELVSIFFDKGQDKCDHTDTDVCDFIVDIREEYSHLCTIILYCLSALFLKITYDHLYKSRIQRMFYNYRMDQLLLLVKKQQEQQQTTNSSNTTTIMLPVIRILMIQVVKWFSHISVMYIYPSWVFCGTAMLICTREPITSQMLLVPITVALVDNFDIIKDYVFLRQSHLDYTTEAVRRWRRSLRNNNNDDEGLLLQQEETMKSLLQSQEKVLNQSSCTSFGAVTEQGYDQQQQNPAQVVDRMLACSLRLYAFGLTLMIPVFAKVPQAQTLDRVVEFFAHTHNVVHAATDVHAPCSEVRAACVLFPMLLTIPMSIIYYPLEHAGAPNGCEGRTKPWTLCKLFLSYACTVVAVFYSWWLVDNFVHMIHHRAEPFGQF